MDEDRLVFQGSIINGFFNEKNFCFNIILLVFEATKI